MAARGGEASEQRRRGEVRRGAAQRGKEARSRAQRRARLLKATGGGEGWRGEGGRGGGGAADSEEGVPVRDGRDGCGELGRSLARCCAGPVGEGKLFFTHFFSEN